jgi:hypothetical protein
MVMTALVDGKQRYSTVNSSASADATMLAAIAKEEQEKSRKFQFQIVRFEL